MVRKLYDIVEYELEYGTNEDGSEKYIYIDLDVETYTENDSFDHEFGTEHYSDYLVLEDITIGGITDENGNDILDDDLEKVIKDILLENHSQELIDQLKD